jgi:AraC-like DNA-binding protein
MPFRRDGIARVVVSSLISLADVAPQISREEQEIALGAILSVLGAASADLSSQASTSAHRCFSRAARFIETNLGDPALTPGKIATACGLSTRQLNRMFEAEHETVSRVVMRRRLERCRLDLLSPALTNRTVSEIAFSWGFNNLSHFSESFRRAYGQSPRSCRRPVGPTRQ